MDYLIPQHQRDAIEAKKNERAHEKEEQRLAKKAEREHHEAIRARNARGTKDKSAPQKEEEKSSVIDDLNI